MHVDKRAACKCLKTMLGTFFVPKRSCWVPDPDEKFIEGLIQETTGNKCKVQLNKVMHTNIPRDH